MRQYRAAILPGRVPVSQVDHRLDGKIPFTPSWVNVYIDFIPFWIRMVTFLLRNYRRRSFAIVGDFLVSIGGLFNFAADVYSKNLSTTKRPFYIGRPRFLSIHLLDPHLMCVPSLHVMLAVFTYVKFESIMRSFGEAEKRALQIEEMRRGALAICQAILFVKQHSVNCIGASIYAMTKYDSELFPPEKAQAICDMLFEEYPPSPFSPVLCIRTNHDKAFCHAAKCRKCKLAVPLTKLPASDIAEIKEHITSSYRRFYNAGKTAKSWEEPLLDFLRNLPKA